MKKILTSMMACACLIGFSACDSFLDEEPKSTMTSNLFYQDQIQIEQAVNYLYRTGAPNKLTGAGSAYMGNISTVNSMLTGYFQNIYEGQESICEYARKLTRQGNEQIISKSMDDLWDACYRAINSANMVLKSAPEVDFDSDATKSQMIAEAKFFRAWNYFAMVKMWGDIPFYTDVYGVDASEMQLERSPKATVLAAIVSDLKDAIPGLPAGTQAENGMRVPSAAASMLLAEVYMYQGDYSNAASAVKAVINSSAHGLTPHNAAFDVNNFDATRYETAYNTLRKEDGLAETIYAYEFNTTISNGGWWPTYAFDTKATGLFGTYSIFERVFTPSNQFLNIYEANDMRIQPNQFFHWEYTHPESGLTWSADKDATTGEYLWAGCWYWYDEQAVLSSGRGAKDRDVWRYAEALLYGAEAIAQTEGVSAEAAGYLAKVQARANMEGKTEAQIATELQGLSKEAFIEAVWTERLREFPLEFKIWDDCVRTGKFPVVDATEKGKVTYVNLVGAQNGSGGTFKDSDLLWPLSLNEIQRNPNLTQNPGY